MAGISSGEQPSGRLDGISISLVEIAIGVIAGNFLGLQTNAWVNYLAGTGSILLTFLAGAEVDPVVLRTRIPVFFLALCGSLRLRLLCPGLEPPSGRNRRGRPIHDLGSSGICGHGGNWP